MAEAFADTATFVFAYTREAHPGEKIPHLTSMEQKLEHARAMAQRFGIKRPMLVDDLDGPVHTAYGRLPNMTYILTTGGRIAYRAAWTDPRTIRIALEQLTFERDQRRSRARLAPYYMEMAPQRVNERDPFMEQLLDLAGPRAVTEFIDAIANVNGEPIARPMREWWESKQG
jgi:hypothetical protein